MMNGQEPNDQVARLTNELRQLRLIINGTLVALILLAGGTALVTFRQTALLRREIENRKKAIAAHQQDDVPRIEKVLRELQPLTESDPRLRAILDAYLLELPDKAPDSPGQE